MASRLALLLLAAALVACGGGGGGSPGSGERTAVAFSVRQFTATTAYDYPGPGYVTVPFTIVDAPEDGVTISLRANSNLVTDGEVVQDGPTRGRVHFVLAPGNTLAPYVNTFQITVGVCYDHDCTHHVRGSPVTLDITYDVRPRSRKVRLELVDPPAVSALVTDSVGPEMSGAIRVVNPPIGGLNLTAPFSGNDLRYARLVPVNDGYRVDMQLEDPRFIGRLGDFVTTQDFVACYDAECLQPFDVQFPELHVAYTITGAPIQPYRHVAVAVDDLVWNPLTKRIVIARASGTSYNAVALDPETGAITAEGPVQSAPLRTLSWSRRERWVAGIRSNAIVRMHDDTLALASTLPIGRTDAAEPLVGRFLRYGPGGALAVISETSGKTFDLRVFDGEIVRPRHFETDQRLQSIAWHPDGHTIFAVAGGHLLELAVSAAGVELAGIDPDPPRLYERVTYSGGRLFANKGPVLDLATHERIARLGHFDDAWTYVVDVAVDETLARAYVLYFASDDQSHDFRVGAYDLDTLQLLDVVTLHNVDYVPSRMIRWGRRGLAITSSTGGLYLLEGGIVDGSPAQR